MEFLNKKQKEAVKIMNTSLLIVAGAGTGKTSVLIEKIIYLVQNSISEKNILALTFTNKAGDEIKKRLTCRGISIPCVGTFHSWCATILREFYKKAKVKENFTIADRDVSKRIIKRSLAFAEIKDTTPRVMQAEISKIKMDIDSDTTLETERVFSIYKKEMKNENLLDFDDLIIKTIKLLKTSGEVRKTLQNRYKYILIDEYQDTDKLQNSLLTLIKAKDSYIIAVGDTDQTIYSWRGASVHNMLSFTETFGPTKTIILTHNYRSTANILTAANAVIEKNVFRHKKEIISTRENGEKLTLLCTLDEDNEANTIAKQIILLNREGIPYHDIAILFRANFQARALETTMIKHKIPYTVLGARFFDRAEIKGLISYLTLLIQPNSLEAYTRASSIPRRGIGKTTLEKIFNQQRNNLSPGMLKKVTTFDNDMLYLRSLIPNIKLTELLRKIIDLIKYEDYIKNTFDNFADRMNEILELIAFSKQFDDFPCEKGIHELLQNVALGSDQDSLRTTTKGVKLMTVHASKGLEFSHVFIAGLEDGLFPFVKDEFEKHDQEEERRLCYVGITRAKNKLYCTYAKQRGFFGEYKKSTPSKFLLDIPETIQNNKGLEEEDVQ